uniref:Carbonic anhydrase n=1 Tax=Heterorhabditis bacteriophora TaxID=37862 RepID=A0A1I7WQ59_HETBA
MENLVASHLPDLYRLIQFHAHWGPTSDCGSEHTLDGKSYPAEIHFVFWNTIYKTYDNAITHSDGLAVVGVFLKEGKYNPDYAYITSLISDAINTKRPVPISTTLDITKMIPLGQFFTRKCCLRDL